MTLDEFENAEFEEGVIIELSRGVVDVHQYESEGGILSDVPSLTHALIEQFIRDAIIYYKQHRPGLVRYVATNLSAKTVIPPANSDRHPDLAVYVTDPPPGEQPWRTWTPDIVIEIVSESSRRRDYVQKAADYWEAGVGEYWIVDPQSEQVQACVRVNDEWRITVLRGDVSLTTDRLPGFVITPTQLFAAGG